MSVKEHGSQGCVTARAGESVQEAARRMDEAGVGYLVVVDDRGKPEGVLSDRDVALRVLRRHRDAASTTVGEIMDREVTFLRESAALNLAFRRLQSEGLRRIPIVDDAGSVVGVWTADDALRVLAREIAMVAAVAEAQSPQRGAREEGRR